MSNKIRQLKVDNMVTKPVIQFADNTWYTWRRDNRTYKLNTIANAQNAEKYAVTVPQPFFPVFFCTCRFIFA
jgi:hypothetical protein